MPSAPGRSAVLAACTLLAAGALLGACGSPPSSPSGPDLGDLAPATCGFPLASDQVEGESVSCGTLTVPARHAKPSGPTYALHVAYFRSGTAVPGALPVILLLGGPGDTIAMYGKSFTTRYMNALGHDVIVFDQRGAGQSSPAPTCSLGVSLLDDPATVKTATSGCAQDLGAHGVALASFDTLESAADVADLEHALHLDKVVLVGWSYGTRLALETLRTHPTGLAGVLVDSVSPPDQTPPDTKPPIVDAALTALVGATNRADLDTEIAETTSALPVPWSLVDGGQLTKVMYAAILTEVMARSTSPEVDVPAYVDQMDAWVKQGRIPAAGSQTFGDVVSGAMLPDLAMYYSISCADDQLADPATAQSALAGIRPALAAYYGHVDDVTFASCASWPYATHPASDFAAVTSDLPALVMAARYDTATTAAWADHAASTLSHSTVVKFTDAAHIVTATEPTGCAGSIMKQFLDDPGGTIDASCAH